MQFEVNHAGQPITIHLGECIQGMRKLSPGSIDVIVTSPPYNLGIAYSAYDDTTPRAEYLRWTKRWARAAGRVLAQEGSLFLNIGGKPSDPWGPLEVAFELRKCGFQLQNVIHWIKSIAIEEKSSNGGANGNGANGHQPQIIARGHYKPINSGRFLNDCQEYIFHFTKSGEVALDRLAIGVPYQDKSNIGRWNAAQKDLRCRGNTWFIPYETITNGDERPHPASFPPRLPEMCLRLHGLDRVTTVADPFLGIGGTAIAALRLGKAFVGYDIDPDYFETARQRVIREIGRLADTLLPLEI